MKDQFMTLVIKPEGIVDYPRSVVINGITHDVQTVALGHLPAAFDIAEQFVKDSLTDLQARDEAGEDVYLPAVEEALHQMHNHKEHGYADI